MQVSPGSWACSLLQCIHTSSPEASLFKSPCRSVDSFFSQLQYPLLYSKYFCLYIHAVVCISLENPHIVGNKISVQRRVEWNVSSFMLVRIRMGWFSLCVNTQPLSLLIWEDASYASAMHWISVTRLSLASRYSWLRSWAGMPFFQSPPLVASNY